MCRAVFLDRDGVLNRAVVRDGKPYPPATIDELELLPGVPEACAVLHAAGFLLVVVTNQPDVARGTQLRAVVEDINDRLRALLPLDEIRTCYHSDRDRCPCRKPLPGLLIQAAADRNIDLSSSFMVGDRWKDVAAGHGAGCKTAFIDYGYAEAGECLPDATVGSLGEAVRWILGGVSTHEERQR